MKVYILNMDSGKPVSMKDEPMAFKFKQDAVSYLKSLGLKYNKANDCWYSKLKYDFICDIDVIESSIEIESYEVY